MAKRTGKRGSIMSTEDMRPGAPDKQPQAEEPAEEKVSKSVKEIAGEKPKCDGTIEWRGRRFETTRVVLERCFLHVRKNHNDGKLGKLLEDDVYDAPVRDADRLVGDWPKKFEIVKKDKAKKIRLAAHDRNWKRNLENIKRRKSEKDARRRRIKAILSKKLTK